MSSEVNVNNPVTYTSLKHSKIFENIPIAQLQRALVAVAIVCAILSLIPNLGTIGSLASRSVAVMAGGIHCILAWKQGGAGTCALSAMRIALIALGLAGVIIKNNILIIAAIAADAAFQTIEAGQGLHQRSLYKALSHFAIILIDGFMIGGMLTNLWHLIVVASVLSAFTMLVFASMSVYKFSVTHDKRHIFDAIGYLALFGIGIASAIGCAEITSTQATKFHYNYTNNHPSQVQIYDAKGTLLGTVEPGKSIAFSVESGNAFERGQVRIVSAEKELFYRWSSAEFETRIVQTPMNSQEFPHLPIGGSSVLTNPFLPDKPVNKIKKLKDQLNIFLTISNQPIIPCKLLQANKKSITFVHHTTGKKRSFNFEAVCAQSGYFKGQKHLESISDSDAQDVIPLDLEEKMFDLLMKYFELGDLPLENLKEEELLEIYTLADYFAVCRLENLCIQEIAERLARAEWENATLLKSHQKTESSLGKLAKLFEFDSMGGLAD